MGIIDNVAYDPFVKMVIFAVALFFISFIIISTMNKHSMKTIYTYAFSALGLMLLSFGAIQAIDTYLRYNVYELPLYGYDVPCEQEADDSWRWRWEDQHRSFNYEEPSKTPTPTDEEIAELKQTLIERCETRKTKEKEVWAIPKFTQSLSFFLIGFFIWIIHWRIIRKDEQ